MAMDARGDGFRFKVKTQANAYTYLFSEQLRWNGTLEFQFSTNGLIPEDSGLNAIYAPKPNMEAEVLPHGCIYIPNIADKAQRYWGTVCDFIVRSYGNI